MSVKTFVDTNVLVYLFDLDAPAKRERARQILQQEARAGAVVLSTQVLQEFYVTVTRKLARPLSGEAAEEALRSLLAFPIVRIDPDLILAAAAGSRRHKLSFWDALILVSAITGGCELILSEDLQHEGHFGEVRIENPFR